MTGATDLWTNLDVTDARFRPGFERMLRDRATAVASGATPAGWKVGYNDPRVRARLGITSSMVGVLLDRGFLPAGQPVPLAGTVRPGAELELAFRVGADLPAGVDRDTAEAAITGVYPAIEIINVLPDHFENITAALSHNVWHWAAILGERQDWDPALLDSLSVQITHNGEPSTPPVTPRGSLQDAGRLLQFVANAVTALGYTLRAGDIILGGMLPPAPTWLQPGDQIEARYGRLGTLRLAFTER